MHISWLGGVLLNKNENFMGWVIMTKWELLKWRIGKKWSSWQKIKEASSQEGKSYFVGWPSGEKKKVTQQKCMWDVGDSHKKQKRKKYCINIYAYDLVNKYKQLC